MLVGTVSIENSEKLADMLKRLSRCELQDCGEHHAVCPLKEPQVLNAKQHEREAYIVAQAGVYGAVTIATNMAGRGTDIILGGNPERQAEDIARKRGQDLIDLPEDEAAKIRAEVAKQWQVDHDRVVDAGGLHIIGTERHEARRIDNQLRGRAGRQGDPGSSRFFVSFGDDVMKPLLAGVGRRISSARWAWTRTPRLRAAWSRRRSSRRRPRSRATTSTSASTSSSTTT